MAKEIQPKDTTRAVAYELWMTIIHRWTALMQVFSCLIYKMKSTD